MFMVEINAKRNADKLRAELIAKGATERQASKEASKREAAEIKAGNDWISKNVNLD